MDFELLASKYPLPPDLQRYVKDDDPWWMRINWDKVIDAISGLIDKYYAMKMRMEQQRILLSRQGQQPSRGINPLFLVAIGVGAVYLLSKRRKGSTG